VSAADLQAVAEGKRVTFKPAEAITRVSGSAAGSARGVFVTKASPDAKPSMVEHPPTGTDFLGQDADSLLTNVFNAFSGRYVVKGALPSGRYDLRVNSGDLPSSVTASTIQHAVLTALHLQIQQKTITRRAYVLRATDASKRLLSPSASTHAVKRGYWHGMFLLMNGSMDDLAYILSTGLEVPVINETGITGTYDARFHVGDEGVESLNRVLQSTMGLELIPGDQELSITVLEVSKEEASKTTSAAKAEEVKR